MLTSRKGPFAAQSLELPEPYSFPARTTRGTPDCWYLSAASNTSSWAERAKYAGVRQRRVRQHQVEIKVTERC